MKDLFLTIEELPMTDRKSSLIEVGERSHYGSLVGKVVFMPTTKVQAQKHIKCINQGFFENLLMCGQWHSVEEFLNEFGFNGEYKLTKSGTMCRIQNTGDYVKALKMKFGI